jgi:2-keto-4-pentenoate hydratase/2-oxohepta-3-ene-1,7-dioic acid hydratase in catechol pathway
VTLAGAGPTAQPLSFIYPRAPRQCHEVGLNLKAPGGEPGRSTAPGGEWGERQYALTMRIARFSRHGDVSYGLVLGADETADGRGQVNGAPDEPGGPGQLMVAQFVGHPFVGAGEDIALTGARFGLDEVRLLAPILPSKVVCIGKNYADHIKEMGDEPAADPVIFLKPSTSVCGPGDPILRPAELSERVDFEGELAVVIGRLCREVPAGRAGEVIFGYTVANDVTARDLQARDGQWTRAKGFDTFCPLGPWIQTDVDPANLALTTRLNDEVRQQSTTSMLLHDVPALIAFVSQVMTLIPGDVLLTGTPAGVGPMSKGDEVSVTIEGIGTLSNPVLDRE